MILGIGFLGALFIVLLVLKVGLGDTDVVDWSWWLVASPLLLQVALVVVPLVLSGVLFGLARLIDKITGKVGRR